MLHFKVEEERKPTAGLQKEAGKPHQLGVMILEGAFQMEQRRGERERWGGCVYPGLGVQSY